MRTRVATLLALLATACARTPPPVVPPEPPVSVLLITIDTLRADRLGAYGDAAARTPVLDGIARVVGLARRGRRQLAKHRGCRNQPLRIDVEDLVL